MQYSVQDHNNCTFLEWYQGVVVELSRARTGCITLTLHFQATDNFQPCSEEFTISSSAMLQQGRSTYPLRFKDSHETSNQHLQTSVNTETYSLAQSPSLHSSPNSVTQLQQRVLNLENLLIHSNNRVYTNLCALLSASFQKFSSRVSKPQATSSEMEASIWTVSMDCSLQDYKIFYHFASSSKHTVQNVPLKSTRGPQCELVLELESFRHFTDFFGFLPGDFSTLLTVKRFNRQGALTSFKAVGTVIQHEQPRNPSLFCLGGNGTRWSDTVMFFHREHGHKDSSGILTAPFLRIQSSSEYDTIMGRCNSPACNASTITWEPLISGNIIATGGSDELVMGKITVSIPFVTFHDMTIANIIYQALRK